MEVESVINEAINIAANNFNIQFPDSEDYEDYNYFLDTLLLRLRKKTRIPNSLLKEQDDLEQRIARSQRSYVRGDSFGDGMPLPQLDPTTEEKKHIKRLELIERLKVVNARIEEYQEEFDDTVKDGLKNLIELVPNEKHRDIMLQFYIYKMSYKSISLETYYSEETIKSYRKRGIDSLTDILFNFCQKTHKS